MSDAPKAKADKKSAEFVHYVTANKEPSTFDILVAGELIKGVWDNAREKVTFEVPAALNERFVLHHHIQVGRVIPKK